MAEGYDCREEGDCSYSWLDELLCEYVDGTMDPSVRRSFEECLETDPVLAQQVARLQSTRTLLCRHGCQVQAPQGIQARVRRRLAWEMLHSEPPYFPEAASRLSAFVAVGSVIAALLMGVLVGETLLGQRSSSIAGRTANPPNLFQYKTPLGLQPAAMTPLPGRRPHGVPSFAQPATLVWSTPASPYYLMPGGISNGSLHPAGLRRTGGAP